MYNKFNCNELLAILKSQITRSETRDSPLFYNNFAMSNVMVRSLVSLKCTNYNLTVIFFSAIQRNYEVLFFELHINWKILVLYNHL